MASCTVKQVTVTKPVTETQFILTLTEDEAKELMASIGALNPCYTGVEGPRTSEVFRTLSELFIAHGYDHGERRRVRMEGIRVVWAD